MLPPRLVRRLVLAPMVIVLALGIIVLSPLLGLLALLFGLAGLLRAGRMRNLRLLSFAVVWFTAELVALVMLFGLWIVSGFGGRLHTELYQERHYAVVRWFLDSLYRGAERTYGLRVQVDEPELTAEERAARLDRPIVVLSRHAGPGDSFLLVHQLLSVYGRRPRVVMKAALQFDPSLDVVGNRLPNVFIRPQQTGEKIFTEQIERLARGLDRTGALVIFPEGANWTPHRWRRGIRRLEHAGRGDLAARARDMPNLLPPRPGGTLAALAACPDADVIFVAHAGLDTIASVSDVWRRFPVDQVIQAKWWRVPSDQVPRDADHETQVQWLYGWWERIDRWVTEHRPGGVPVPPGPVVRSSGPAGPHMPGLPRDETGASMTDEIPIAYLAAVRGTPVLTSTGTQIGTLEHVLQVPEVDVFDGIVIATEAGLRFIDADDVQRITDSHIWCSLDDAQAAQLPPPGGAPVYRVDALQDSGHSLHDVLGRMFRRPHWTREDDQA
jgi:1-acyl-sn-glycerol-3-phosphate acyltransferase